MSDLYPTHEEGACYGALVPETGGGVGCCRCKRFFEPDSHVLRQAQRAHAASGDDRPINFRRDPRTLLPRDLSDRELRIVAMVPAVERRPLTGPMFDMATIAPVDPGAVQRIADRKPRRPAPKSASKVGT